MHYYVAFKHAHMGLAFLSVSLFVWRAALVLSGRQIPGPLRIVPHVVDTFLLGSALTLLWLLQPDLRHTHWLQAKLLMLPVYIGLASAGLKRRQPLALLGALATVAAIVVMAVFKLPA